MLNYLFYRLALFIVLALPRRISYGIAVFVSDLHYLFAFADRRNVGENLKAIFPDKTNRQIRRIRLAMCRNFARHVVDFLFFSKIDRPFIEKNIRIENRHYVDEALAAGKGAIALTAHLGSWELGGAVIGVLGHPFYGVALRHKHKMVDDFFNAQRELRGVKVIPLGAEAVRQSIKVLRENKILGLVGDRDFNGGGVILDFFGKPALFPEGPAVFCLKLGSPIVPAFMLRNKDDTFTFRFEKPIEFASTGKKSEDLKQIMRNYIVVFQDYIRKYPDQWYMFRKFWLE